MSQATIRVGVKSSDPADEVRSDRDLVAACLANDLDHAAFRRLYERYGPEILRYLERLLGDRDVAEDALQDSFVRLHRGLKRYDPERPLRPYVFRIAHNVAIEALRRRARRAKLDPAPLEAIDTVDQAVERNERAALVRAALAALPAEHRSVIVLRHTHALKLREVADALDCTPRTARNRLRAASTLLERELRRRGIVPEQEGL